MNGKLRMTHRAGDSLEATRIKTAFNGFLQATERAAQDEARYWASPAGQAERARIEARAAAQAEAAKVTERARKLEALARAKPSRRVWGC